VARSEGGCGLGGCRCGRSPHALWRRGGHSCRIYGLILGSDLGEKQRVMGANRGPSGSGPPGAGGQRVGGRRLKRVDGSMRTGASVAGIVWDLKKRRIKRKARGGSRIAWGECEVKGKVRCQTVSRYCDGQYSPASGHGGYSRGHIDDWYDGRVYSDTTQTLITDYVDEDSNPGNGRPAPRVGDKGEQRAADSGTGFVRQRELYSRMDGGRP
jgi:hypothetical protein